MLRSRRWKRRGEKVEEFNDVCMIGVERVMKKVLSVGFGEVGWLDDRRVCYLCWRYGFYFNYNRCVLFKSGMFIFVFLELFWLLSRRWIGEA